MSNNGIRHKADAVKPQIPKPRPKLTEAANYILKGFSFEAKVTFQNMPRSKASKRLLFYVLK